MTAYRSSEVASIHSLATFSALPARFLNLSAPICPSIEDHVDAALQHSFPSIKKHPESDTQRIADVSGKEFFRAEAAERPEQCSYPECRFDAACTVETEYSEKQPYCSAHTYVRFAEWMVGA